MKAAARVNRTFGAPARSGVVPGRQAADLAVPSVTDLPALFSARGVLPFPGAARRSVAVARMPASQPAWEPQGIPDLGRLLLKAQENERRSIARELHDDVTQQISAAALELAALLSRMHAGEDVEAPMGRLITRLQALSRHVHNMSRSMHPHALETLGLARALSGECREFADRTGIGVAVDIAPGTPRLAPEAALAALRVCQEALKNVEKHARATSVRVHLAWGREWARLTIADTGVGFRAGRRVRGIGLAGMRERALAAGGSLSVSTAPGEGTRVVLTLPAGEGEAQE